MSNLIEKYKSTHRRIRKILNPYTNRLCPVCPSPCCRKPTKVSEFDVLLANACGCSLPSENDAASELMDAGIRMLTGNAEEKSELVLCDYLGQKGCIFPDDLRPFECTRYICPSLREEISSNDMREMRALLHKLDVIHRDLLTTIKTGR